MGRIMKLILYNNSFVVPKWWVKYMSYLTIATRFVYGKFICIRTFKERHCIQVWKWICHHSRPYDCPLYKMRFLTLWEKRKKNKHLISRTNHPCLLNATYTNHQSRQFGAATQYSQECDWLVTLNQIWAGVISLLIVPAILHQLLTTKL
jgi:hypothetical protein